MLSRIRARFASWAVRLERSADLRLCSFMRRRLGWKPTVVPYLGHGTTERAHMRARVLLSRTADARRRKPRAALIAGLAPFLSIDVPGEQVTIAVAGRRVSAVTSPEGYVEADVELPGLAPGWHRVTFGLTGDTAYSNDGRLLVVDPAASLGVVSDIDDTVIHTGLTRLVDALRTTLLIPEHARTEVAGAAELYRALVAGTAGGTHVFYVSTGAWNLFPVVERFLSRKGFPEGPLLMTDWGRPELVVPRGQCGLEDKDDHRPAAGALPPELAVVRRQWSGRRRGVRGGGQGIPGPDSRDLHPGRATGVTDARGPGSAHRRRDRGSRRAHAAGIGQPASGRARPEAGPHR